MPYSFEVMHTTADTMLRICHVTLSEPYLDEMPFIVQRKVRLGRAGTGLFRWESDARFQVYEDAFAHLRHLKKINSDDADYMYF